MNLYADIAALMLDLGSSVTDGTKTAKCLLDSADELIAQGNGPAGTIGNSVVLTVRTGDVSSAPGTRLVVDGKQFVVREKYVMDDGMLTRLLCSKG